VATFNQNINLEKELKQVLAFFDLFNYPLTPLEIWHYLDKKVPFSDIIYTLYNLTGVESKDGFVFLLGRAEIINSRQKRYNYTKRKLKIAHRFTWLFSLCPFIEVILLGNSLGAYNLRDESDIDFVIISQAKRLWLTRLYCAGLTALLNSRPKKKNKRDKICLSFYISTAKLNLDNLQLQPSDPYFFYWLRSLVLLYNRKRVYNDFLRANNIFLNKEFFSDLELEMSEKNGISQKNSKFLNSLENLAKKFQLAIMAPDLKKAANNSVGVVISDQVLKLYLRDKRQEYLEKYGNKLQQIFT
jgi:hypothetical protein